MEREQNSTGHGYWNHKLPQDFPTLHVGTAQGNIKEHFIRLNTAFHMDLMKWHTILESNGLMTLDSPLLIGGQGVVIQIDESLFRHKPKVK